LSVKEILDKLRWHPNYDFSKVVVVYIDRPKGFSEIRGDEIEKVGFKFIELKTGTMIPTHRVVEIRYENKVVWRKKDAEKQI
jgi:uncharacterized protein (UPF0248 family)